MVYQKSLAALVMAAVFDVAVAVAMADVATPDVASIVAACVAVETEMHFADLENKQVLKLCLF